VHCYGPSPEYGRFIAVPVERYGEDSSRAGRDCLCKSAPASAAAGPRWQVAPPEKLLAVAASRSEAPMLP